MLLQTEIRKINTKAIEKKIMAKTGRPMSDAKAMIIANVVGDILGLPTISSRIRVLEDNGYRDLPSRYAFYRFRDKISSYDINREMDDIKRILPTKNALLPNIIIRKTYQRNGIVRAGGSCHYGRLGGFYRKHKAKDIVISNTEFEWYLSNNTGYEIIDEYTKGIPSGLRSDTRQDIVLYCLENDIDFSDEIVIKNIADTIYKKHRNRTIKESYELISLFSKMPDGKTELWQMIADDSMPIDISMIEGKDE